MLGDPLTKDDLVDLAAQIEGHPDNTAPALLGGIVTGVRQKFTKRGEPCGFITLEDYEGSGELALFGKDWGQYAGMFTEGASVYIKAKMQPRYQHSELLDLKVQSVDYLQSVKDKAIDRITIQLTTDNLNEQTVADLSEIIAESPGKTKLFFQLRDSQGKHHVLMQSKKNLVDVRHTLIDFIEQNEALDYKIN